MKYATAAPRRGAGALVFSMIGVLGLAVHAQQDSVFREYPKKAAPTGPLHPLLAPLQERLAGELVRLRLEPERLLERIEVTPAQVSALERGSADPEARVLLAELSRLRGAMRRLLGARSGDANLGNRGRADLQVALEQFRALDRDAVPWRFQALLGQGRCEADLGHRIEAVALFDRAREVDPFHEQPYLEKARIYAAADEPIQARRELARGLQQLPDEIHLALEMLALDLHAGGDHSERLAAFRRAVRGGGDPALRSRVAALLLQQGVLLSRTAPDEESLAAGAAKLLRQATELDPQSGDAWFFLAEVSTRLGRFLGAIDAYDLAIENSSRYRHEARLEQAKLVTVSYGVLLEKNRSRAYRLMRHCVALHDELRAEGFRVLAVQEALARRFAELREQASEAYDAQRIADALSRFREALQIDPENAFLRGFEGMCLEEIGCSEEACKAYELGVATALSKGQDAWWPFLMLEERARERGRPADAQRIARSYLEKFPEGKRAAYFAERYPDIQAELNRKKKD